MNEDEFHQTMVRTGLISPNSGKYTDHASRGGLGQPLPTDECRVCGLRTDPYEDDYGICAKCYFSQEEVTEIAVRALIKRDKSYCP
jgi:hypothetical protein